MHPVQTSDELFKYWINGLSALQVNELNTLFKWDIKDGTPEQYAEYVHKKYLEAIDQGWTAKTEVDPVKLLPLEVQNWLDSLVVHTRSHLNDMYTESPLYCEITWADYVHGVYLDPTEKAKYDRDQTMVLSKPYPENSIVTPDGMTYTKLGVWDDNNLSEWIEYIVEPDHVWAYQEDIELEPWTDEDEIAEWKEAGDDIDEDYLRGMRVFNLPLLMSPTSQDGQQVIMHPKEILKCYGLPTEYIKGWLIFEDATEVYNSADLETTDTE